jgi:ribosomal protein S18 acetylase RimI-like enzyme
MLGKEKVGYFNLKKGTEEAELDDFYVLPEYRGKGIGTKVLSYCISQTNTPIFLYVFRKNTDAIRLYTRFGFSVSEEIGNTRLIMRRGIDNNRYTVNKQKEI